MTELLGRLRGLNDRLGSAEVQKGSSEFPDGAYIALVEKADLVEVKSGDNEGQPQVKWWLRVLAGPAGTVNRIIFHYHQLFGKDDEMLDKRLSRFRTDLSRIGQEITSFDELEAILQCLVDGEVVIKLSLKTGQSGIQNCYFNGLAEQ